MGLYKPQSQFMTPNNQTIDNGVDNAFITRISGSYCSAYIWDIPTINQQIPNINLNKLVKLNTPLYNNDVLNITLPSNSFSNYLPLFLNRSLFWNICVIGRNKKITSIQQINTVVETIDTTVQEKINALDLMISEATADIVQINANTQSKINNANYQIALINSNGSLTQAQKDAQIAEWNVAISQYRNEQTILVTEKNRQIESYQSQKVVLENQLHINVTVTETLLTIPNGNFKSGDYVYIENTTLETNFFFIGVNSDGRYKLYNTREKAMSMIISPEYKAYQMGNGILNNNISSCAKSDNIPFRVINSGTLKLTPELITKFYYTFKPVYSQENDLFINNYQATLFNSNMEILEQTDVIYSSDIKLYVNGLLSGEKYYVQFMAENNIGFVYDTGLVEYTVEYKQPRIKAPLLVENNCDTTAIDIDWEYLISVIGEVDCYEHVVDFIDEGNTGLWLCPYATLKYTLDEIFININETLDGKTDGSLPTIVWQPTTVDWVGDIMRVENSKTGEYVLIGYNGFSIYIEINGIRNQVQIFDIEINPKTNEPYIYFVGLTSKNASVHKFLDSDIDTSTQITNFMPLRIESDKILFYTTTNSFVGIRKYVYFINGRRVGESISNSPTDIFAFTNVTENTTYEAYVQVTDNFNNVVTSSVINVTTKYRKPIIRRVSLTAISSSNATLVVNTVSKRDIVIYTMEYEREMLVQSTNKFELIGLDTEEEYESDFQVRDDLVQLSDTFPYTFKTVVMALEILDVITNEVGETTAKFTLSYNIEGALDKFVWLINDVPYEESITSIHTLTNLQPDTEYILNVQIIDLYGNSVISEDVYFKTEPLAPIINNIDIYDIEDIRATFDVDVDAMSGVEDYEVIKND